MDPSLRFAEDDFCIFSMRKSTLGESIGGILFKQIQDHKPVVSYGIVPSGKACSYRIAIFIWNI